TPLAQVASLIGPHGLGLVTLLAACALALPGRRLRPLALLPALALLALLALGWVWGSQRLSQAGLPAETGLRIRLVQPNAAQDKKWQPELVGMFLDRQLAASAAEPRADVVIWPETAVPWLLQEEPELRARIATAARGATVILGARRLEERPGQPRAWFNSLFVLGPDGAIAASYDKHHLVPFGEYLPFSALFDRLGLTGLVGGSFSPGPGPKVIDGQGLPGFRPLICYEAIFPDEMPADTRPAWLVQITNDAWFGSSIGPYQHFAQARMRAIEQGLPLARAANTGISAMIDPLGRIVASQPLGTQGFVDAILPSALPPTLYSRLRDWPFLAALLGLVVICITLRPRKDPSY
ncbi:MAG: apolipoprotein N-acyltransferase, partial [Alphaproteobacteria bacterium]